MWLICWNMKDTASEFWVEDLEKRIIWLVQLKNHLFIWTRIVLRTITKSTHSFHKLCFRFPTKILIPRWDCAFTLETQPNFFTCTWNSKNNRKNYPFTVTQKSKFHWSWKSNSLSKAFKNCSCRTLNEIILTDRMKFIWF